MTTVTTMGVDPTNLTLFKQTSVENISDLKEIFEIKKPTKKQQKANEAAAKKQQKANEAAAKKQQKADEAAAKKQQKADEAAAKKQQKADEAAAKKQKKATEIAQKKVIKELKAKQKKIRLAAEKEEKKQARIEARTVARRALIQVRLAEARANEAARRAARRAARQARIQAQNALRDEQQARREVRNAQNARRDARQARRGNANYAENAENARRDARQAQAAERAPIAQRNEDQENHDQNMLRRLNYIFRQTTTDLENESRTQEQLTCTTTAFQTDECPICFEDLGETNCMVLRCGHKTCGDCILRHFQSVGGRKCPVCRDQYAVRIKGWLAPIPPQ